MVYLSMEIQLTKTKTITIGGGTRRRHRGVDVVGVDLFTGDARGCPAVRLTERKGALHVAAAGFVPPPIAAVRQPLCRVCSLRQCSELQALP